MEIHKNEKKYKNIKYILKKADSDILTISFSGFPGNSKAKYNYMKTLREYNCNQLFILDNFGYKRRGSYYLGEKGDWFLVQQIESLIKNIVRDLKINHILTVGSSKGGTSALFYGIRLKAEVAIIGAPQYYVGNYLNTEEHIPILEGIMGSGGGIGIEKAIDILNKFLPDTVKSSEKDHLTVYVHYSPFEHTYQEHIQFMIRDLKENGYHVIEDSEYCYEKHSDVAAFFPAFLQKTVSEHLQKWS